MTQCAPRLPEDAARRIYVRACESEEEACAFVLARTSPPEAEGDPVGELRSLPGLMWGAPVEGAVQAIAIGRVDALRTELERWGTVESIEALDLRTLVDPSGAPTGPDPALARRGAGFLERDDCLGMWQWAREELERQAPESLTASTLRWLQAVLGGARPPATLVRRLLRVLSTGRPSPPSLTHLSPLARDIVAAQAEMLTTPCEASLLAGRVESALAVIARVVVAPGTQLPGWEEARNQARDDPHSLVSWLQWLLAEEEQDADPPAAARPDPARAGGRNDKQALRVLKVDPQRVDALMDLVGELVVAKNAMPFLARRALEVHGNRDLHREIKEHHAVINRITEELQQAVMRARMVPVSQAFGRFPRLVRDLAEKLGKDAVLQTKGEDIEADKNVVEDLTDPLMHIIRNSLDHGLEPPSERVAAGKPAHGTIELSAQQHDDQVVIDVSDDGRGIDPDRVRRKAWERGLITEEQRANLSDEDAVQLVFAPGFSTAESLSDVSGRGVGMDVVRSMVMNAGGTVHLSSRLGRGTRVRLQLPLSMSVTHVMLVGVGGTTLGVPFQNILETLKVPAGRLSKVGRGEVLIHRRRIVPVFRLAEALELPAASNGGDGSDEMVSVVLLHDGEQEFGVVVDLVREGVDVIIKPLDGVLSGCRTYAGTALLGDGHVLLVLNLRELSRFLVQAQGEIAR